MYKIPCRKCRKCGLISDFTEESCVCGAHLVGQPIVLVDESELNPANVARVAEGLTVYVQKCPRCKTLNFTQDKDKPVQYCYNCTKIQVADETPVPFNGGQYLEQEEKEQEATRQAPAKAPATDPAANTGKATVAPCLCGSNDENAADSETSFWLQRLGNIKQVEAEQIAQTPAPAPVAPEAKATAEEESAFVGWGSVLGEETVAQKRRPDLTLTALRYGVYSFTIPGEENTEYMLGRSANHSTFLQKDLRVGNNHCLLIFRDGVWKVRDNCSRNGTFVDGRDIGENGECPLRDGGELKLGHESDSMAFRVTIA